MAAVPRSRYRWNDRAARYIGGDGRIVSQRAVRAELDAALDAASRRAVALGEQLRAGDLSLRAWRSEMRVLVRNVHLYSAAAARGGWAQMTQAAYGQVGGLVRFHYERLERLALQISHGLPLDGAFFHRVGLYVQAGRTTYDLAEFQVMDVRGFNEERNVLSGSVGAERHCEGARSCKEQSRRGWVKLGALIPIGQRLCLGNCRCRKRYRRRVA